MQNSSITPRLIVASPDEAIAFYQKAFGAELEERFEQDGVVVHALLKIGRWTFSLSEEVVDWGWLAPGSLGGSSVLISLDVDDARVVAEAMVSAGATVVVPIEDRPYGRCEGRIQDPSGHLWIPTHEIGAKLPVDSDETSPAVLVQRIVADLSVRDTAEAIEFYAGLFGLELAMNLGWVATLTPGGYPKRQLTLLTEDDNAPMNPQLSVDVDDLDLVWRRAQELGADIAYERTVEPWGVERFFVRDPSGNVINVLVHTDEANGM